MSQIRRTPEASLRNRGETTLLSGTFATQMCGPQTGSSSALTCRNAGPQTYWIRTRIFNRFPKESLGTFKFEKPLVYRPAQCVCTSRSRRLVSDNKSNDRESNQQAFTTWPHILSMKLQDNPTSRYCRSMTHIYHTNLQKCLKIILFFFSWLTWGQICPAMTILMYCP